MTRIFQGFWACVILFLMSIPEVYMDRKKFTRSVCLKVVKEFIEKNDSCRIQLKEVKKWLAERAGTSMCGSQIFCNVYFWYDSDEEDEYYWLNTARIRTFNKSSGQFQTSREDINCINPKNVQKETLYINAYGACKDDSWCGKNEECSMKYYGALGWIGTCICVNDTVQINGICRKVDVGIGKSCTFDFQCSKAGCNRVCDNDTSTCLCVAGFTEINGHCLQNDLEVNQTCWYDEQCNGNANSSVCRRNMCVCMDEHYFANGTCQPSKREFPTADTSNKPQPFQEHGDSSVAQNVAAVIGGFVLGILTCFAAVYVIYIRSRRRKHNRNTEDKFVNNISYEKDLPTNIQKDTKNLQQAKISHVKPIIKGDPEYSNTRQVKSETNDIYNHLNEKTEDDTMDVYDHAVTGATGMSNEEEYTHLSR